MALVGNLKDLKLPNLIQINCMERNIACLSVEARDTIGKIYFDNGQVIHAVYGQHFGEDAIHELLLLKEGIFKVEKDVRAPEKTIHASWNNLLLERLRVIDEGKETTAGQLEDMKQSLLAVKGVMACEILNQSGEIITSSVTDEKREGYSFLIVFSFKEVEMFSVNVGEQIRFMNMKTAKTNIICFKFSSYYIVVEYDYKIQIENMIPNITNSKRF
jgi:hypothetical protein